MQVAAVHDIEQEYGDTDTLVFRLLQKNRTPVNLTGSAVELDIYFEKTLKCSLTTSNGGVSLIPLEGKITIDCEHANYVALPSSMYNYKLRVIDSNSVKSTKLRGSWNIS